jgi:hypothetical protein
MTAQMTTAPDSAKEATRLSTAAKVVAVLLLVLGSIITLLGLLLVNGSSSDSPMGRAFTDLGWIAAGIGLVHVVTAVLALVARWLGRVLMVLLGAAGCLVSLLTLTSGGLVSVAGLVVYGAVLAVYAFSWRVPPGTSAQPDPG